MSLLQRFRPGTAQSQNQSSASTSAAYGYATDQQSGAGENTDDQSDGTAPPPVPPPKDDYLLDPGFRLRPAPNAPPLMYSTTTHPQQQQQLQQGLLRPLTPNGLPANPRPGGGSDYAPTPTAALFQQPLQPPTTTTQTENTYQAQPHPTYSIPRVPVPVTLTHTHTHSPSSSTFDPDDTGSTLGSTNSGGSASSYPPPVAAQVLNGDMNVVVSLNGSALAGGDSKGGVKVITPPKRRDSKRKQAQETGVNVGRGFKAITGSLGFKRAGRRATVAADMASPDNSNSTSAFSPHTPSPPPPNTAPASTPLRSFLPFLGVPRPQSPSSAPPFHALDDTADAPEPSDGDPSISLPWNFQHSIHVDEGFSGLPPSWTAQLPARGFSDAEIVGMARKGKVGPSEVRFPDGARETPAESVLRGARVLGARVEEPGLTLGAGSGLAKFPMLAGGREVSGMSVIAQQQLQQPNTNFLLTTGPALPASPSPSARMRAHTPPMRPAPSGPLPAPPPKDVPAQPARIPVRVLPEPPIRRLPTPPGGRRSGEEEEGEYEGYEVDGSQFEVVEIQPRPPSVHSYYHSYSGSQDSHTASQSESEPEFESVHPPIRTSIIPASPPMLTLPHLTSSSATPTSTSFLPPLPSVTSSDSFLLGDWANDILSHVGKVVRGEDSSAAGDSPITPGKESARTPTALALGKQQTQRDSVSTDATASPLPSPGIVGIPVPQLPTIVELSIKKARVAPPSPPMSEGMSGSVSAASGMSGMSGGSEERATPSPRVVVTGIPASPALSAPRSALSERSYARSSPRSYERAELSQAASEQEEEEEREEEEEEEEVEEEDFDPSTYADISPHPLARFSTPPPATPPPPSHLDSSIGSLPTPPFPTSPSPIERPLPSLPLDTHLSVLPSTPTRSPRSPNMLHPGQGRQTSGESYTFFGPGGGSAQASPNVRFPVTPMVEQERFPVSPGGEMEFVEEAELREAEREGRERGRGYPEYERERGEERGEEEEGIAGALEQWLEGEEGEEEETHEGRVEGVDEASLPEAYRPLAPYVLPGSHPTNLTLFAVGTHSHIYASPPSSPSSSLPLTKQHAYKYLPRPTLSTLRELRIQLSLSHPKLLGAQGVWVQPSSRGGYAAEDVEDQEQEEEVRGWEVWVAMPRMERSLAEVCVLSGEGLELGGEGVVARLMWDVLEALLYLHERGFVHRDVRSDNLLFSSDGRLLLGDFFHTAQLTPEHPTLNDVVGVWYWMAPELRQGQPYTTAVDIYSLGATLWELLEGVPPHSDIEDIDYLRTITYLPPLSAPERWSDELKQFLSLCAQEPARRPTAAMLVESPFVRKAGSRADVVDLLRRARLVEAELQQ